MVFSSTIFLFVFLPAAIICYYGQPLLSPKWLRNAVLLIFSYLFYLYGAAGFLLILILSTLAYYVLGRLIDRKVGNKRLWLSFSLLLNLGLLAYFKYANFFVGELNSFFLGWNILPRCLSGKKSCACERYRFRPLYRHVFATNRRADCPLQLYQKPA
jgi:alginate O-acetyltransferase complex protein AlgI